MTTERFDKAAADWDGKSRRVQLAGKISSAISTLPLNKEMNAMEYGCGTGLVGLAVAPLVQNLTTIDSSKGMLEVLQKKCETQGIHNITVLCCDLLQDEYKERHDLIFCAMTLHHIKDYRALLQRFCKLLNPGGYLAVADLVSEDGSFHKADAEGIHHKGFDPNDLGNTLKDCAMDDIQHSIVHTIVKEEDNNREFPVFLLTARKK